MCLWLPALWSNVVQTRTYDQAELIRMWCVGAKFMIGLNLREMPIQINPDPSPYQVTILSALLHLCCNSGS